MNLLSDRRCDPRRARELARENMTTLLVWLRQWRVVDASIIARVIGHSQQRAAALLRRAEDLEYVQPIEAGLRHEVYMLTARGLDEVYPVLQETHSEWQTLPVALRPRDLGTARIAHDLVIQHAVLDVQKLRIAHPLVLVANEATRARYRATIEGIEQQRDPDPDTLAQRVAERVDHEWPAIEDSAIDSKLTLIPAALAVARRWKPGGNKVPDAVAIFRDLNAGRDLRIAIEVQQTRESGTAQEVALSRYATALKISESRPGPRRCRSGELTDEQRKVERERIDGVLYYSSRPTILADYASLWNLNLPACRFAVKRGRWVPDTESLSAFETWMQDRLVTYEAEHHEGVYHARGAQRRRR
jgi:hypothetical protein